MLKETAVITSHAVVDTRHEPLDNPCVCRTTATGSNKSPYLKVVFNDRAHPAIGPYPSMLLGHNDNIRD